MCQRGDCWCECSLEFPQCNCPHSDLDTLEKNLLRIREAWRTVNREFQESGGSGALLLSLPHAGLTSWQRAILPWSSHGWSDGAFVFKIMQKLLDEQKRKWEEKAKGALITCRSCK